MYGLIDTFLSDLDLHRGGFVDWDGTVTNPDIRVVGQENAEAGSMHLWVQNVRHTWKNVAEQQAVPTVSGQIQVPGFRPGASYDVEVWDTYAHEKSIQSRQVVTADSSGNLNLAVDALQKDLALTLRART